MPGQIIAPKNLCILRLSAIGDVCHAVAMVQAIQRQYPDCKITWVIGKVEAMLLKGLPGVRFVVFDKGAGLAGYKALRQTLNGEEFDVLLHMQIAFRASLASLMIKAKVKVGFDSERAKEGQWLFTNKKIAPQAQPHVLDGFLGFAEAIGVPIEKPEWHMPINDEDQLWVSEQLQTNKPIAIICPAASKAERNWHPTGYGEVAHKLVQQGFSVVICGGPTELEKKLAAMIQANCPQELINLVGQTTLPQMLACLNIAHLVIAPDTGPAHMAVTVSTPVVGLYAHSNPMRTGPYTYQAYVVNHYKEAVQQQHHKPVAKLPWGTRAKGEGLMDNISIDQVMDKVRQLIADHYPELTQ
ncbi:glycosyltransferase family 9 protein [Thalassotalea euphylliae]|uniref:glycosyltransferase family 9 protein n=1 Tax=Thalassotalea euphylliae TaxID=1655234 RepID=UPI0036305058